MKEDGKENVGFSIIKLILEPKSTNTKDQVLIFFNFFFLRN